MERWKTFMALRSSKSSRWACTCSTWDSQMNQPPTTSATAV